MNKNSIRSRKQVDNALRRCGMLLIAQRCELANNLPHAENHRHKGWRVIVCDTYPETRQGRIDIECDSSRHLVDVCCQTQKDALAAALARLGWSDEALTYTKGRHDLNVKNLGACRYRLCPVCTNQLSGKGTNRDD